MRKKRIAGFKFMLAFGIMASFWISACAGSEEKAGQSSTPAKCSTQAAAGTQGPEMEPGGNCIQCHRNQEGPIYTAAGTVMKAGSDDTGCTGVAGVTVEITDAAGANVQVSLTTGSTGNFFSTKAIATPFKARVKSGGNVKEMVNAQSLSVNCADCHTAQGANGAPGRIVAP